MLIEEFQREVADLLRARECLLQVRGGEDARKAWKADHDRKLDDRLRVVADELIAVLVVDRSVAG
jgi:hypothetical protein